MEKYNKQKAILTALLKWVETEFFGIFVFLFFIAVAKPAVSVRYDRLLSFYRKNSTH